MEKKSWIPRKSSRLNPVTLSKAVSFALTTVVEADEPNGDMVSFSGEQFKQLMEQMLQNNQQPRLIPTAASFSSCTARYRGERDPVKLDEFVTTISVYKDVLKISDEDAITGIPLLLEDFAVTWWQGVKDDITTWAEALTALRNAFAPTRPSHMIYAEIFEKKQPKGQLTDEFICHKRALISLLPAPKHPEDVSISMIYHMLHLDIRANLPRERITGFQSLLEQARAVEQTLIERQLHQTLNRSQQPEERKRCSFCKKNGHVQLECRKKQNAEQHKNPVLAKPVISCFGCKTPGYYRGNCPVCKAKEKIESPTTVDFNCFNPIIGSQLPTISISVLGMEGIAYIDTAARTSVAGRHLMEHLLKNGVKFDLRQANVRLANGTTDDQPVGVGTTTILMGNILKPIKIVILPAAQGNRTLLGIDFLEQHGVVLNLAQRYWYFIENPEKTFQFYDNHNTPRLKVKDKPESSHSLVSWAEREQAAASHYSLDLDFGPSPSLQRNKTDYSPGTIQDIFRDSLPADAVTPERGGKTAGLFKEPPIKQPKTNVDPWFTELHALDITLRPDEGADLILQQRQSINQLILKYARLFEPLGEPTPYAEHKIDTQDHPPIATHPYRLSPTRRAQLRTELDKLQAPHIIEPCESPWAAPVVLVPKKDGSTRLCIDYRKLNSVTTPDRYPLPRIDDLLHSTKKFKFKTTLDLQSGYYQVKVAVEDQLKTAFITPFGTYKFLRMPFGLRNAPATFQRLMDHFKIGLTDMFLLTYLDDLIIFSPTFEKLIFERIKTFNLKINREKSSFCCISVRYLGHIITSSGIEVDPEKTAAIRDRREPQNAKQVVSFLQTCSWYRRFIPGFANITQPLSNLVKKNATWKWGAVEEGAFNKLKELLVSPPVLQQAKDEEPFFLKTDASGIAIGAVLVQGEKDQEHPIEYASRLLTSAERNYSTIEREALALIWAVAKFRGYIEGSEVTLLTDHQPLKWLMSLKSPTGRLARWALQLQPYNVRIIYTPGKTNVVADTLSRPPCNPHTDSHNRCEICSIHVDFPSLEVKAVREKQLQDDDLRDIIKIFEEDHEDLGQWTSRGYLLNDGILYRYCDNIDTENAQLVVPVADRDYIKKTYHNSPNAGHCGIDRTIARITPRYYWKGMRKDIETYVKNCIDCQKLHRLSKV